MTRRNWLLFAAMCVIWGIPYLLIRVAVRDVAPGTLVFLRCGIGALVLLPPALRSGGFAPVLRRWRPVVAFAAAEMAGPWLLLSDAERHVTSSLSGLLIAAVPLVGVLVAFVPAGSFAPERVDRTQLAGLLAGVLGVALLVGLDLGEVHAGALVELLVVVVGYAVGPAILARSLADLPRIPVVCAALGVVAAGYLPYAALRPPTHVAARGWWSIVALGLVCTALAFVLFVELIGGIGPGRATVITYVNPAVAVLVGVTLLGERFTLGMALGFPLILAGSVFAARSGAQSMRTSPPAVLNTTATTPVPSSDTSAQSTSIGSSGCRLDVPR